MGVLTNEIHSLKSDKGFLGPGWDGKSVIVCCLKEREKNGRLSFSPSFRVFGMEFAQLSLGGRAKQERKLPSLASSGQKRNCEATIVKRYYQTNGSRRKPPFLSLSLSLAHVASLLLFVHHFPKGARKKPS